MATEIFPPQPIMLDPAPVSEAAAEQPVKDACDKHMSVDVKAASDEVLQDILNCAECKAVDKKMEEDQKKARIQAVMQKLSEDTKARGGKLGITSGAFGDMEDCNGLLEDVITPKEGGTYVKFYGCSYLFKGNPMKSVVEGMGLSKAFLSALPREIILRSWVLAFATAFLFLFARRRFIHYARVYVNILYRHVVKNAIPRERYNTVTNELRRAVDLAIMNDIRRKKLKAVYDVHVAPLDHASDFMTSKRDIYELIANVAEFAYFFLEHDSAYRLRYQDICEQINKENARKSAIKEVRRLLGILYEREHPVYGIIQKRKWKYLKLGVTALLILSGRARRIAKDILLELDVEKVKLDEADWYFCLRRRQYAFRGVPIEERVKEKERIDREKGHVILKFQAGPPPLPPMPIPKPLELPQALPAEPQAIST